MLIRIKHQANQITYVRTMAFLAPLPPYPNSLAFRAACDKSWFMSPSLWTRHVVTSTILDTGKFPNSLEYKTIMFLQEMEFLPESVPPCPTCQQPFSSLYESMRAPTKGNSRKGRKANQRLTLRSSYTPTCSGAPRKVAGRRLTDALAHPYE